MIGKKMVAVVFALLMLTFVASVYVLPAVGLEEKDTSTSYKQTVFNESKVGRVDIEIDEDDWDDLVENATKEEYKRATVTVNGKKVSDVAIRAKGNSSLTSVANSDSDRYSLKIDFDHYDSSQSLYGLKKLNLNNNYSDSTQMREFVSYEMMEEMGIATPAHSYMYVTINGEDYGLLLGVEQVDETFLASEFESNDGFLFKPDGVGSDLKWISDDLDDYTGVELKTNESIKDQSTFTDMLDAINNGGDLEEYLDVDEMLRYFAVNTALVNLDSYQGQMKHNYYLYEEDGTFSLIPWDYNMSFGGFGVGMGGRGNEGEKDPVNGEQAEEPDNQAADQNGAPQGNDGNDKRGMGGGMMTSQLITDSAIDFSVSEPVANTTLEERPLLNALLSNSEYKEKYEEYLKTFAEDIFTEERVSEITNNLASILTTYVESDPTKFFTTDEFLKGVSGDESLAEFTKLRSESILEQLSGERTVESQAGSSGQGQGAPNGGQGNPAAGNEQDANQENPAADDNAPQNGARAGNEQGGAQAPPAQGEQNAPPDAGNGGQGEPPEGFDPTDRPDGFNPGDGPGGGGPQGNGAQEEAVDSTAALTVSGVSIAVLLLGLGAAWRFRRRSGFR
ncbi:CotH kinase family protein [Rossellomorea marisflavi]|uniref:CotH kinase family protein n=1 Tax=Rossellomorea marisflavi TaxID=189381 RepID=UPI0034592345